MRWVLTIWTFLLLACFAKIDYHQKVKSQTRLKLEIKPYITPSAFLDYIYQPHPEINIIDAYAVKNTFQNLGLMRRDSIIYEVFTCFRHIKLANGNKGRC